MATFAYPGPRCKQVGILCDTLLSSCELHVKLKKLPNGALTKGVLIELGDFRKDNDISWEVFCQWIVQLKGEDDINLASLKVSLSRLNKKRAKLKRNKEHSKLEELMSKQHFSSSQCHVIECEKSAAVQEEVQEKMGRIVQLGDKLTESRMGAERNGVNLFSVNKRLRDLQFDIEQLKLSVTTIESNFDSQCKHLNGQIAELSSALDAAHHQGCI